MTKTLSEIQREFGRELRKTRLKYNLAYGYIAKQLKCSPAFLNAVESGYASIGCWEISFISSFYFHKFGRNNTIGKLALEFMMKIAYINNYQLIDCYSCN